MVSEILKFALCCIIVSVCIYPIVDRICECFEKVHNVKTFNDFIKKFNTNKNDLKSEEN